MKILDLNNLTTDQVKKLNEISLSIKPEFNQFTEDLLNSTNKKLPWLLHPLTSRNPYQSDLFLNVCYLKLSLEFIRNNQHNKVKVYCQSKEQLKTLKAFSSQYPNITLFYVPKKSRPVFIINTISLINIFLKSVRYRLSKDISRTIKFRRKKNIVLLDTFLADNSLKSGKYIDRYYPGILDYLDKDQAKRLFWMPTIMGKFKPSELQNIFLKSKENIVYKHDFLKFNDYAKAIWLLITNRLPKGKKYKIDNFDLTTIIKSEFVRKRFNDSTFEGILNYIFASRLHDANVDVKTVIDWNENQPIDKGLIKGIKTFHKDVYTKGYQGYIISTNFNFYIQPTQYEIDNEVIPDEICVVGKASLNNVNAFSPHQKGSVSPAYRFSGVFRKEPYSKFKKYKIVVVLPIGTHESLDIIQLIFDMVNQYGNHSAIINFKLHPLLNRNRLIADSKGFWHNSFHFLNGDINDILKSTGLLIGSTSSTLLESLAQGVPVIVLGSQNGLTQNPIPESIDSDMWKICYTPAEIVSAIKYFEDALDTEKYTHALKGEEIKHFLFEIPSRKNTLQFLNLNER